MSHYDSVTSIGEDGEEFVDGNTDEYFNIFTLYKNNTENEGCYRIYKDDMRINKLIENLILHDLSKDYIYLCKTIIIDNLDYCFEKSRNNNSNSFSFGWWSDNTMEKDGLVKNGTTEYSYTFEINRDNLELIDQFISNDEEDYNIKNIYKNLWTKIKNDSCIKNYLFEFFKQISRYTIGKSDYICDVCKKICSKKEIVVSEGCCENHCKECYDEKHDSRIIEI